MRNFLKASVLGVAIMSLSGCGFLSIKDKLDPQAMDIYSQMYDKFVASGGDLGAATVWRMEVDKGITPADIKTSLDSASVGTGLKNVGEMPLSQQLELETGKKQLYMMIYQYCSPSIARQAVDFSPYFAAYLPCRIAVVEDKEGRYWLYGLNMDMFVHGGKNMPQPFKKNAEHVRNSIHKMMEAAAHGGF
ncbi:MAG: DUF302 domain-containing protein [Halothiobacillus sp.]|jgi:uncharacterized protein (DUF302 family)|uniref:DUF302 domain-containing protein n=1 Tax=Halothiobacillus sp. TaxID=1891311 RepID=UPI002AD2AB0D|nr:DUF302 domain-containing protein [Halothiobacillus sp.]MDA3878346.1 DUF302 domain-containing protein [Halothiobacillus sp.]